MLPSNWWDDDDDIAGYQEFTTMLIERGVRENEERLAKNETVPDIVDIKDQIVFLYAINKIQYSGSDGCLATIFALGQLGIISSLISKTIDAQVNELFEKRFVGRQDKLNKIIIHSSDTYVRNNSTRDQEGQSIAYSLKTTKTTTASVTISSEIKVKEEIKIPFIENTSIEFGISASGTKTDSQSREETVTVPPQKVTLGPKSKIKITFDFYEYYDINKYFLDFVVDESSRIWYPDFSNDIYYGDPKCCKPCLLFMRDNIVSSSLPSFLRQNPDSLGKVRYRNESSIRLEEKNGKFILRNAFPATEKIKNFGVDITFGEEEPI